MALSGFCIGWLLRNGRVQLCINGAPLSPLVSFFLVYGCLCLVSGLGAVCYHILFPLSSFFSLQSKIGGCDCKNLPRRAFPDFYFHLKRCWDSGPPDASLLAFGFVVVALHSNTLRSISFKSAQRILLNICTCRNIRTLLNIAS